MWKQISCGQQQQLINVYHNKIHALNASIKKGYADGWPEKDIQRIREIRKDYIKKLFEARRGFALE